MDQLLAAVHALYHPTDGASQAQANEWLMKYQNTKDAWGSSLQLLHHPSTEMQYFGASTLYAKARSDWTIASSTTGGAAPADGGLTAAEQSQLMNQLLTELKTLCNSATAAAAGGGMVMSKLALALGVMASKTPQGPAELLSSVTPLAAAPFPSPSWSVLLELLAALGEEVARAKLGYTRAEEVKSQLRRQSDAVSAALARALRDAAQAQAQGQAGAQQQQQQLDSMVARSLTVVQSWRDYGLSLTLLHSSGILGSLCELAARWMNTPLADAATATTHLALLGQTVELVERALEETSYPRPAGRDEAVDALLAMVLRAGRPVYERTVGECVRLRSAGTPASHAQHALLDRADQLCMYLCRLSSAIGESEMDYLACEEGSDDFPALSPGGTNRADCDGSSPAAHPPPNPLHLAFFEFHLLLTGHPYNRALVETSLDTWSCLQDQPVAERKFPALKGEIFVQLLATLVGQASYPRSFRAWGEALRPAAGSGSVQLDPAEQYFSAVFLEDPDSFLRFRAILLETFLSIQAILGPRYVEMLARALEGEGGAGGAAAGAGGSDLPWQRVEAILSALLPITSELSAEFSDESVPLERKRAVHEQLAAILRKVWTLAPATPPPGATAEAASAQVAAGAGVPPLLLSTCCAFIKSYSFLYEYAAPSQAQEMLERSVAFLLGAMPHTQAQAPSKGAASAASAFTSQNGQLSDQANVAGLAFRSLCSDCVPASRMLVRSPALLGEVVRLLFSAPGFSERVVPGMKSLWLQGLASLVALIAYSGDSVAQVQVALGGGAAGSSAGGASMAMATSYLQEISSPMLNALRGVFAHLAGAQAAHAASGAPGAYVSPPAETEAVRSELHAQLQLLQAVLEQLATPTAPPVLQHKAELIDLVVSAPPGVLAAAPPSVALGVFQTAWPMLQQASALLLPLRDAETLGVVVRIYASAIPLLYPHDLGPLLGALVQAGLALYAVLPLPAVLELLDRAVGAHNFGAAVDMRDMWNSALTQVYKCTMINTKENFKSHTEVFENFFTLCSSFYEHGTYCFLSNPGNTLPHILQFCVQVLDSLSSSRAVMQRCLSFLQQLLESTACIDVLPERQELHALFAQSWGEQGSGLLRQLVANVADASALPPLIDSKIASVLFAAARRFPDLAKPWIEKAVLSDYVGGSIPHVSEEDKMTFLAILWPLRSNVHQWKSLWLEFAKVCQKLESMDALLAFQMQPSGKLRGSQAQDDAFSTL